MFETSSVNITTCIQPIRNTLIHCPTQTAVWIMSINAFVMDSIHFVQCLRNLSWILCFRSKKEVYWCKVGWTCRPVNGASLCKPIPWEDVAKVVPNYQRMIWGFPILLEVQLREFTSGPLRCGPTKWRKILSRV